MLHRFKSKLRLVFINFYHWCEYEVMYLPQKIYSLVFISITLFLSLYLYLNTLNDSLPDWIMQQEILSFFKSYNEPINQISLGVLVSSIFYLLVIMIPEALKRDIIFLLTENLYVSAWKAFSESLL